MLRASSISPIAVYGHLTCVEVVTILQLDKAIWNVTATKLSRPKWYRQAIFLLFFYVKFLLLCPQSSPYNPVNKEILEL